MTYDEHVGLCEQTRGSGARRPPPDQSVLIELIKILAAHPGGLRRWSVMRAIRNERERAARDIPQKLEDEVERTFRRFCAESDDAKAHVAADAVFYRPREKAGEVWAVFPDRAKAHLEADLAGIN